MSGKAGQTSQLPREIPEGYRLKGLTRLDGRCRSARELKTRRQAFAADPNAYLYGSLRQRFLGLEVWIERQEAALVRGEEVDHATFLAGMNTFLGFSKKLEAENGKGDDLARQIQTAMREEEGR
ncbi:hypothetical protein MYX04_12570 [Nitrospiraceae bacterium AH_259_D15_M11_P09]|nr:hypothetical protein [Nitrospiraceae bacterium AH_259_D15_M11_P09]